MDVQVRPVRSETDLAQALSIRTEVFVGEQGVRPEEEVDGADRAPGTCHVLAVQRAGDQPVGTARLVPEPGGVMHVGRVAVRAAFRGQGVGAALMAELEHIAAAAGARRLELAAQESAIGFYERLGYTVSGPRFTDARIWHRHAEKVL